MVIKTIGNTGDRDASTSRLDDLVVNRVPVRVHHALHRLPVAHRLTKHRRPLHLDAPVHRVALHVSLELLQRLGGEVVPGHAVLAVERLVGPPAAERGSVGRPVVVLGLGVLGHDGVDHGDGGDNGPSNNENIDQPAPIAVQGEVVGLVSIRVHQYNLHNADKLANECQAVGEGKHDKVLRHNVNMPSLRI